MSKLNWRPIERVDPEETLIPVLEHTVLEHGSSYKVLLFWDSWEEEFVKFDGYKWSRANPVTDLVK